MTSPIAVPLYRERAADMARFAEQHRAVRAVRPRPSRLRSVRQRAVISAPHAQQLEAQGGAK